MTPLINRINHILRHTMGIHEHGILCTVIEQRCTNKARTEIREPDREVSYSGLLLQRLNIYVLKSLSGTVGWCHTNSLGPRNGRDDGNLPTTSVSEIAVGNTYQPGKTDSIRLYSTKLFILLKGVVLPSHTCGMEVKVHSSHLMDKFT